MLGLVRTKVPLLELRGVRGLGRLTYKAPFFCPEPHRTVHATKVSVAQADGVPAIVGERSCGTLCACRGVPAVWRQLPLHICQHGCCKMQSALADRGQPRLELRSLQQHDRHQAWCQDAARLNQEIHERVAAQLR